MKLFANKPCSFGGQKFKIGAEIPAKLVANPKAQEKMGVLSISDDEAISLDECTAKVGIVKFAVPVHAEEGDLILEVSNEELTVFTDILQIGVSKTEDKQKISEMIQNIESVDLLIMLDALDGRKHVKEEAQARASVITEAQAKGEENPDEVPGETPGETPDETPGGDE